MSSEWPRKQPSSSISAGWRQLRFGPAALATVLIAGTAGYVALGFSVLHAVYQTVTTVSTVGFRELRPQPAGGRVFTIVLILVGVGTALYTSTLVLEAVIEGKIREGSLSFGDVRQRRQLAGIGDLAGYAHDDHAPSAVEVVQVVGLERHHRVHQGSVVLRARAGPKHDVFFDHAVPDREDVG